MKKAISVLLSFLMILSISACSNEVQHSNQNGDTQTTEGIITSKPETTKQESTTGTTSTEKPESEPPANPSSEYEKAYIRKLSGYSIYIMLDENTNKAIQFVTNDIYVMKGSYTGDLDNVITISWNDGWDEKLTFQNDSSATLTDGNGFDWEYETCDVNSAQEILSSIDNEPIPDTSATQTTDVNSNPNEAPSSSLQSPYPPLETESNNCSQDEIITDNTNYVIFELKENEYYVTGLIEGSSKHITIPDRYENKPVTKITSFAFQGSTIASINLSNKIIEIGESAFYDCHSLTEINIPSNVKSIGTAVFANCYSLTDVSIGNKISNIPACAFSECSRLSRVFIPNNITAIEFAAFFRCNNLKNISLPNSLTRIDNNAFEQSGLTSIVIPDSVTELGYCVFAYCNNLTDITIGKEIKTITPDMFIGCSNLHNITFSGTKQQWMKIELESGWNNDVPATKVVCTDGNIYLNDDEANSISTTSVPKTTPVPQTTPPPQTTTTTLSTTPTPETTTTVQTTTPVPETTTTVQTTIPVPETTPAPEPIVPADVLIISDTYILSDTTINTDVYITSTGVVEFNNVTVNGNIYCYGQLKTTNVVAVDVFAYNYGGFMTCSAFDGTHGKISGGLKCDNLTITNSALEYAFSKWGKQ